MQKSWRLSLAVLSLPVMAGVGSGPIAAQDQGARRVNEVIVTAQRREQAISDVPIAMTYFSGVDLRSASIDDVEKLQLLSPSLTVVSATGGPATATISLRGQVQDDSLITLDPSVGLYLDDTYVGRSSGAMLELFDVERVEILKGPQGTLYGRNTTGGTIKVISRKADPSGEFSGFVGAGVGNFDAWSVEGAVNLPIVKDKLAIRVAGQAKWRDGYSKLDVVDFGTGLVTKTIEQDDVESETYRINAVLNLSPRATISVTGDYWKSENNGSQVQNRFGDMFTGLGFARSSTDFFRARSDIEPFSKAEAGGVSIVGDFELTENVSVKGVLSYRKVDSNYLFDTDGSDLPAVQAQLDQETDQYSAELQLSGNSFDNRLDWVAGFFYFDEEGDDNTLSRFLNPAFSPFGVPSPLDPFVRSPFLNVDFLAVGKNKSKSGFAHATYQVTDRLDFTAGIRYTEDTKELIGGNQIGGTDIFTGPVGPVCLYDPATPGLVFFPDFTCQIRPKDKFSFFSWTVGIDFQVTDDIMVYAKGNSGNRSGGQNIRGLDAVGIAPFQEEKATDVEIGMKGLFADGQVVWNADYYHTFYADVQQSIIIAGTFPTSATINSGDAGIDGVETDLSVAVFDNLTLSGTGAYIRFDFKDPMAVRAYTPKWQASATAVYTQPLPIGEAALRLDYAWRDNYTFGNSVAELPVSNIKSRGLLNARLSVTVEDFGLELAVFGTNLTDEEFFVRGETVNPAGGIVPQMVGEPRMYGFQIRKEW